MSKNYRVYIPGSSKWEKCTRKIIVELDGKFIESEIKSKTITFEFEVPDKYEWIHSNKIIDNCSFNVSIEFSNRSKKEIIHLVPEEVCWNDKTNNSYANQICE